MWRESEREREKKKTEEEEKMIWGMLVSIYNRGPKIFTIFHSEIISGKKNSLFFFMRNEISLAMTMIMLCECVQLGRASSCGGV